MRKVPGAVSRKFFLSFFFVFVFAFCALLYICFILHTCAHIKATNSEE